MLPYRDSRFTILALIIFFLALGLYAFFEARNALYGPRIDISDRPSIVHDKVLIVRGRASNITELIMNGNPIPVTEDGAFEERHILAPGYNRLVLEARDSYGRKREQVLEVIYEPPIIASLPAQTQEATSSPEAMAPGEEP